MKQAIEDRFPLLGGIVPIGITFVPVTEEEFTSIETVLGVTLPIDYRDFVGEYGASAFGESVQFRLLETDPVHPVQSLLGTPIPRYEEGHLSAFYGGKEAGTYSLANALEAYKRRMPDTMIPIADDGGGNQICFGIKGKEHGKVYYWDHHNEWDEQDFLEDYGEPMPADVKFQNVYLIAESFEDFIRRLEKTVSL